MTVLDGSFLFAVDDSYGSQCILHVSNNEFRSESSPVCFITFLDFINPDTVPSCIAVTSPKLGALTQSSSSKVLVLYS